MPVKIFAFRDGKFNDVSSQYISENTAGWWSTVLADDLDGDGDQDLIARQYRGKLQIQGIYDKPFQVFANDFDSNGTNDIFLARYLTESMVVPIRGRECTSQQMPMIADKFPTFREFANSDLQGILGEDMNKLFTRKRTCFPV